MTVRIKVTPSDYETTGREDTGSMGTSWSTAAIAAPGYVDRLHLFGKEIL